MSSVINNLQLIVFMKGTNVFRAMRESSHKDKRSNLPRVENTSSAQIKKKKKKNRAIEQKFVGESPLCI